MNLLENIEPAQLPAPRKAVVYTDDGLFALGIPARGKKRVQYFRPAVFNGGKMIRSG